MRNRAGIHAGQRIGTRARHLRRPGDGGGDQAPLRMPGERGDEGQRRHARRRRSSALDHVGHAADPEGEREVEAHRRPEPSALGGDRHVVAPEREAQARTRGDLDVTPRGLPRARAGAPRHQAVRDALELREAQRPRERDGDRGGDRRRLGAVAAPPGVGAGTSTDAQAARRPPTSSRTGSPRHPRLERSCDLPGWPVEQTSTTSWTGTGPTHPRMAIVRPACPWLRGHLRGLSSRCDVAGFTPSRDATVPRRCAATRVRPATAKDVQGADRGRRPSARLRRRPEEC